jgi:hypothetical protein
MILAALAAATAFYSCTTNDVASTSISTSGTGGLCILASKCISPTDAVAFAQSVAFDATVGKRLAAEVRADAEMVRAGDAAQSIPMAADLQTLKEWTARVQLSARVLHNIEVCP